MPTFIVNIPGARIGSFLAGAAVASVIGGTAAAITSTTFTYATVKNGYYTIPPAALVPTNNFVADGYHIYFHTDATHISASTTSGLYCFATGVNLPQGATIVSVTTWYTSGSRNVFTRFLRNSLSSGAGIFLINDQIEDDSNTRKSITNVIPAALRTVNNAAYAYTNASCIGNLSAFHGARINYQFKTAGD